MKANRILSVLLLTLMFSACGTQKAAVTSENNGPMIQTTFFGAKFEDSSRRVYNKLYRYHPTKGNDGSYTIFEQDFGGHTWHFIEFSFVEDLLTRVNFQQEYKSETAAKSRFESIYSMLRMKYGDMVPNSNDDGFSFKDSATNMVSITVHPGTSKGGQEFWYCDLTYYFGGGMLIQYLKSLNEL